MRLKLISCNVFQREACLCIAQSPHVVDAEFTELGEHAHSATLRQTIQSRIDAADAGGKAYDAILLLFGLCGNASVGLQARTTQLVIPRAHDCCTILLGSKAKYQEHFKDAPSTPFGSAGYFERGEYFLRVEDGQSVVHYGDSFAALVEQYGPDDAKYIWETMHPPTLEQAQDTAVFIDLPETAPLGYAHKFQEKAEAAGKKYVRLEGSLRLIRNLLNGQWDPNEFLTIPPGHQTIGVYDFSEIIRAKRP